MTGSELYPLLECCGLSWNFLFGLQFSWLQVLINREHEALFRKIQYIMLSSNTSWATLLQTHIAVFTLTLSSEGLRGQEAGDVKRKKPVSWPFLNNSSSSPTPPKKKNLLHSCSNQENMHSFLTDWIMWRFEKIVQFALFSFHPLNAFGASTTSIHT